ncbi:MAG: response regulator [Chthoniobacterales bacterium]
MTSGLTKGAGGDLPPFDATSELNNLLQIVGGTTELLESIWEGTQGSEKYLNMLRTSVARAVAITAQLVENAGGVSGRVVLPVENRSTNAVISPEAGKRRVLVVDDEPMALTLQQELLTNAGYEVVTAGSGFEALDLLVHGLRFDIVLLDLTMPFMDGEETFRRMRTIVRDLRVLLATGFVLENRLRTMLADGLCGYIRKPLPPDEVLAALDAVVRGEISRPANSQQGIAAAL